MIFQRHTALITLPKVCSVDVRGVLFYYSRMSDCPASNQSDTGMDKNADAGTSPVQGYDTGCRNVDASGIGLDADATAMN